MFGCLAVGGQTGFVDAMPSSLYKEHRYPVEIISHCVWLYHRFSLSLREIEELMMARGVLVTYETIHQWCRKFGQAFANQLRRRRPRPGDKWHLGHVGSPRVRGAGRCSSEDLQRGTADPALVGPGVTVSRGWPREVAWHTPGSPMWWD